MNHVVSLVSTAMPMWQARRQHEEVLDQEISLHQRSMALSEQHHRIELDLNRELFERDCQLERELLYGQMSHDYEIARREGERDAWSQRSQLLQTLMVVDTLMFSSAYALLVQGDPPQGTPLWVVRCYAVGLGAALALLSGSVWCCLKLQARLSRYDIHRPDVLYVCGGNHRTFQQYYLCHCRNLSRVAFFCFYTGTAATMGDGAIFALTVLWFGFSNMAAAIIFAAVIGLAMALPLIQNLTDCLRVADVLPESDNESDSREEDENDAPGGGLEDGSDDGDDGDDQGGTYAPNTEEQQRPIDRSPFERFPIPKYDEPVFH